MAELRNASVLGRLLEEISWEGSRVKGYRDGGRGKKNVLTAEVLLPLTFLPREAFLAEVLHAAHGAERARMAVAADAEQLEVTLLPDEVSVGPACHIVQPDATFSSDQVFALIEAKRIRRSAFQPDQLAREFVAVMRAAHPGTPLLLLILGAPPPVVVKGVGEIDIRQAIVRGLANVVGADEHAALAELENAIDDHFAWITWAEIADVVTRQATSFGDAPRGLAGTINRLAAAVSMAVEWHGEPPPVRRP